MEIATIPLSGSVECRFCDVGGGRGVFATEDIPAGSVVMFETPILCVADKVPGESLHTTVARRILQSTRRDELSPRVDLLHPRRLSDLASHALHDARQALACTARSLTIDVDPPVSEEDALLLLLKVRLNAFESGLYIELALVNHACFPNCAKFGPGQRVVARPGTANGGSWCDSSEIVAVRPIVAGEEVTISYFAELERSAASRSHLFRKQHFADITVPPTPASELEALVHGADADEVRLLLLELEDWLDMVSNELRESASGAVKKQRVKELGVKELFLSGKVHQRHLVLCRIRKLRMQVTRATLTEAPNNTALELLLRDSTEVRATQALFLPSTHCDFVETLECMTVGITMLLARDRQRLFDSFPVEYGNFDTASAAEASLRQAVARITGLYGTVKGTSSTNVSRRSELDEVAADPVLSASRLAPAEEDWSIFD